MIFANFISCHPVCPVAMLVCANAVLSGDEMA